MTPADTGGATKPPTRSRKRSTPRVIAVVLNWNLAEATLECLESLQAVDYPDFEVLVVDNGSDDGSQAAIEGARPDLAVLQTGSNLGYAGGNNVGIEEAIGRGADFVWILNNDTKVEPDALTALIRAATAGSDVGIVGSAVINSLPEAEAARIAGAAYRWNGERLEDWSCPAREETCPADGHIVDGVAGTSLLLRTAMLKDLGGFEERFFHYWDDVELCDRARRAGWQVRYACLAKVWHAVSATIPYDTPQARYYFVRNWLLFARWARGQRLTDLLRRDPALTIGRVTGATWVARGRFAMARASVRGALDARRERFGPLDGGGIGRGMSSPPSAEVPTTQPGGGLAVRAAGRLMRAVRPGALSRIDPAIRTGSLARVLGDKGIEAVRGLLLAARSRHVALPCFVGRHVKVVGAGQLSLGPGVQLQDYVAIDAVSRRGVRIGRGVTLDRFVVVRCTGALRELGEGVEIGDHSSMGAFSYLGGSGGLVIGRNVLGGQRLSFHPENHTFERSDLPIREQGSTRLGIVIEDDCWLGSGSIFLDGVRVGRGSVVAAGSVVTGDVPPYSVVGGVPAKVLRTREQPPA